MNKKYPISLFITGFIMNLFFRLFYLSIPAIILMILGIWFSACLYIGIGLFLIALIISLILQLMLKNIALEASKNESFQEFQDAISSHNWYKNVMGIVVSKINENTTDDPEARDYE